jgi:hypothetical protein
MALTPLMPELPIPAAGRNLVPRPDLPPLAVMIDNKRRIDRVVRVPWEEMLGELPAAPGSSAPAGPLVGPGLRPGYPPLSAVRDLVGISMPMHLADPRRVAWAVGDRGGPPAPGVRRTATRFLFLLTAWDEFVVLGLSGWRTTPDSVAALAAEAPPLRQVADVLDLHARFLRASRGPGVTPWCPDPVAAGRQVRRLVKAFRSRLTKLARQLHDQAGDAWLLERSWGAVGRMIRDLTRVGVSQTPAGPVIDFGSPTPERRARLSEELYSDTVRLLDRPGATPEDGCGHVAPGTSAAAPAARAGPLESLVAAALQAEPSLTSEQLGHRFGKSDSRIRQLQAWKFHQAAVKQLGKNGPEAARIGYEIAVEARAEELHRDARAGEDEAGGIVPNGGKSPTIRVAFKKILAELNREAPRQGE